MARENEAVRPRGTDSARDIADVKMDARTRLLASAKEVFETKDAKEMALMLQSNKWVVVNAYSKDSEFFWCLIRIL